MKEFVFSVLLIVGLLVTSCGSIQTLSYDEMKPAKVSFPNQIQNVAVVNNTVPTSGAKQGILTIGNLQGDGKQTSESLAEALADSKFFNQIVICDSALRSDNDPNVLLLSQEKIDRLATELGVDMIFSVDQVEVKTTRKAFLEAGLMLPYNALQANVTPVLHVYLPGRSTPLYRISQSDSLVWDINPMLSDKEIILETAHAAALLLNRILVPYWELTSRFYFDGGGVEMRDGAVCAREGNWQEAKDLWMKAYNGTKSKAKQVKPAFNLALASEMLGQMDEAEKWLKVAVENAKLGSDAEQVCQIYLQQIRIRQGDLSMLNAQMTRFGYNF